MNIYESNSWMQTQQGAMRPGGLQLTGQLLELAALVNEARILDLGCGLGGTVSKLKELGYQAVGVDISPLLVQQGLIKHPGTQLMVGDAANLPFDAETFDAVIYECSLSVMPARQVLQECNRVLQPSGKVLISDIYARQKPPIPKWDALDVNLLLQNEWIELLEQSGFAGIQFVDCSKALTEFLVKVIWEHGSLENILDCRQWSRIKPAKPGYFLAVATKTVRKWCKTENEQQGYL